MIDSVVSPVICQDSSASLLVTDQRGAARSVGASCDIGAFEYGALPTGFLFGDDFEQGHLWMWAEIVG